jgi:transmembrane sensor
MSEVVKLRTQADVDEEAAAWVWRLDSAAMSATGRQDLELWLQQDPRHRRAFDELAKVWGVLDKLAEIKQSETLATLGAAGPLRSSRRLSWWMAAAASIALAASVLMWLHQWTESQTIETAVGQQRIVTLADNSIVTLNTNTVLDTDLTRHTRDVYLRKGEAHFQVAHDRSRPFLVHAGEAVIRAVGTQFDVRIHTDRHVEVLVNEGRVEVQPVSPAADTASPNVRRAPTPRVLSAGEELSTRSADYGVVPVVPQQLANQMAWREGAIVFTGEALGEAVAEVERYTDIRIVVTDPQVAALHVGGRFKTNDLQGFFDALQAALPVSVRTAEGFIYVEPRS